MEGRLASPFCKSLSPRSIGSWTVVVPSGHPCSSRSGRPKLSHWKHRRLPVLLVLLTAESVRTVECGADRSTWKSPKLPSRGGMNFSQRTITTFCSPAKASASNIFLKSKNNSLYKVFGCGALKAIDAQENRASLVNACFRTGHQQNVFHFVSSCACF